MEQRFTGRPLIAFGVFWLAVTLLIGGSLGRAAFIDAGISRGGHTAPAWITAVEQGFSPEGTTYNIHYTFRLDGVNAPPPHHGSTAAPQEQPHAPRQEHVVRGVVHTSIGQIQEVLGQLPGKYPAPATVEYDPSDPAARHRLQGFGYDSLRGSGSPIFAAAVTLLFAAIGIGVIGMGVREERLSRQAERQAQHQGGSSTGAASGVVSGVPRALSLPGFTVRQDADRLVLQPTWVHLVTSILLQIVVACLFGLLPCVAFFVIQGLLSGGQLETTSSFGKPTGQATVVGRGIVVALVGGFGALSCIPVFYCLSILPEALLHGRTPSILDRSSGLFLLGKRVVCRLDEIAHLHLRRRFDPRYPDWSEYEATLVHRNGTQLPLGYPLRAPKTPKMPWSNDRNESLPSLDLGVCRGRAVEAVMRSTADLAGWELVVTEHQADLSDKLGSC